MTLRGHRAQAQAAGTADRPFTPPGSEAGAIATVVDGKLYVLLERFSRTERVGPVRGWQPWAAAMGTVVDTGEPLEPRLPARGEACLVQRVGPDYWLTGWEPA